MTFCGWCGAEIPPHQRVCPRCARPLDWPFISAPSNTPLLPGALLVSAVAALLVIAAILSPPTGRIGDGTSTKPYVTLTLSGRFSTGVDLLVASIQPAEPPADFRVNMEEASTTTFGTAVGMPTSPGGIVSVTVGSGASLAVFAIQWANPGGSGLVSQGDHFVITATGAYTTGGTYSFLLIWSDGSALSSLTWIA